ncbi:hypothetical protein BGZ65_008160 [Modicella reniformis]|uniref:Uncharacterized protein n=1 Tax=Modicella reniformis TaxID=1440133 RepID=A0A9P6J6R2_9FUNG|nr:hypothetical protein BGZ65_008160 [Modicella reniformis]
MGSQLNLDSFTKLHLPPSYPASSQPVSDRATVPARTTTALTVPAQTPSYISTITERVKNDIVKQEAEKKVPKPRKKRGQYRKTILKQQAAAAAAAVAAGLPPPEFPPLPSGSKKASSSSSAEPSASAATVPTEQPSTEQPSTSTVDGLDVQSQSAHDTPSPRTLELESELAMLAEEAEEDKRRREEEAADRILKRAQHLRSLKSKLATAQIQIGQDLRYQSLDLFSQLYDEVLEDIGRDTDSEMLNLFKSAIDEDQTDDDDSDQEDPSRGYMHTRSADRPRRRDLIPNHSTSTTKHHDTDHHHYRPQLTDDELDSDSDNEHIEKISSVRNGSQFIGQSWDVGSGLNELTKASGLSHDSNTLSSKSSILLDLVDDDDLHIEVPRKSYETFAVQPKPVLETREDIQGRQYIEMDALQLQQRKDYEEFQRRQLDQLRELQIKHNEEMQRFNARDTVKSSVPTHSNRSTHDTNGAINPLPMSTMTLALTAMNEKKKQMKRAMKRQFGQDERRDKDTEQYDHDYGDQQQHATTSLRLQSPSSWNRKQNELEDPDESPPLSPKQKTRKRKNASPMAQIPKRINASAKTASKPNIGFNKTLLSHFEKWNPDEKTENLFEFVLSDPPDIDVDETEIQCLLNGERDASEHEDQHVLNGTPTSSAFRWYQEQQKLAQELAPQPKIPPLQLSDQQSSGNQVNFSSSSFLVDTSGVHILFPGDGEDDWNFQPFTMDPTEEYLSI